MKSKPLTSEAIHNLRRDAERIVEDENRLDYHSVQYDLCTKLAQVFHVYGINLSIRSEWMEHASFEVVSLYMAYYDPELPYYAPCLSSFCYLFYDERGTKYHKKVLLARMGKFLDEIEEYLRIKNEKPILT